MEKKLKKEEIYVAVSSKKQAKQFKAILLALGEEIDERYFENNFNNQHESKLLYSSYKWVIAIPCIHRTEITIKQLIELLAVPNEVEKEPLLKIAVKVSNRIEKEAVSNHVKSDGNIHGYSYPLFIFLDKTKRCFFSDKNWGIDNGYTIISFEEFAKTNNIKPFQLTEDGFRLYKGDIYYIAFETSIGWLTRANYYDMSTDTDESKSNKIFSSKQAALDYIEKQNNPTEIEIELNTPYCTAIVKKDIIELKYNRNHHLIINPSDIELIANTLKKL